ncbi:MAG: methylated-DNA-protein-cysteine S-methyltransferase [Rhodospirillaceae bacterium]|nr:MAG: methylated-DNA-protein-cysteine S-methyltransferase [Rhodospirillaceae bacterium]
MHYHSFVSPLGLLTMTEENGALVALEWGRLPGKLESCLLLQRAAEQLSAYFRGERQVFDLSLAPRGTAFQQRVWAALGTIPFGIVRSYGALAADLGMAPRAVGMACARNPIPILIPCHRIMAANGGLGGYSEHAGIEAKRHLLALEGVHIPRM